VRLLAILFCPFLLQPLVRADEVPSVAVQRIPEGVQPPRIDGVLDDEAWNLAKPLGELRQVEPVAVSRPSERTEVRLLRDGSSIYLGLWCFDSDPSEIRANQARRDANLDPDDRVELLFDPFLDRRNAFWFQIGAAGSKGDALITRNGSQFNKQWDTIWYGEARVTDEGWFAEIELPAASINFDPEAGVWGFNLRRLIRRRNEEARWATPTPKIRFFSVANAGTLHGLDGLEQGIGIDLKPFGVLDYTHPSGGVGEDLDPDAGLDLFYRVTPAVKLSLSVNTDFAETEVDDRLVNLTRFPLFFPEKRDFFLEDSGAFVFGSGTDVIPFFSRRIGLGENGEEVPLRVATKLTGQTNRYSFGFLDVQTDSQGDLGGRNLSAGRFSRNVLEQSDVGVIFTRGDPLDRGRDATLGADVNLRTDEFLGDDNLRFSTFVLGTEGDGSASDGLAYRAVLDYPNDEVDLMASYEVIEDGFDPALGRVRRTGIKRYRGSFAWRPRLHSAVRQLDFRFGPELFTDAANDTESVDVFVRPFGIELESGDRFDVDVHHRREVLDEDFEITDDVTIDQGAFTFTRYGASFETSEKRPVSLRGSWTGGEFFDGKRDDYTLELGTRFGERADVNLDYELNDVRLDDGDFRVHVARVRLNLQFGPELSWASFFQYDNQSDQLGLNSRVWWIPRPETELFLVLNQGWEVDSGAFSPLESQVTLKIGYTLRL